MSISEKNDTGQEQRRVANNKAELLELLRAKGLLYEPAPRVPMGKRNFKPVPVKGIPMSQMIIEERG